MLVLVLAVGLAACAPKEPASPEDPAVSGPVEEPAEEPAEEPSEEPVIEEKTEEIIRKNS